MKAPAHRLLATVRAKECEDQCLGVAGAEKARRQGESLHGLCNTDLMQNGELFIFGGDGLEQFFFGLLAVKVVACTGVDQQV